ncbi:hypothetical protein FQR65_LT15418 [Abscondita terminalis]|nr:hypothetical protein FQR65_LT15418 [Abscondita terminalis]
MEIVLDFAVYAMNWTDPKTGDLTKGFRELGFLPEAFVNMLGVLGWNDGSSECRAKSCLDPMQLLGKERNIVTPVAGTTRDSIRIHYNQFGHEFLLIDTAGMRRKSKVNEDIEFYSVMRTIKALEDSDVVILMLDAQDGIEAQDINIFHLAEKNKKGVMIVVNKWDLIEKDNKTMKEFEARHLEGDRDEGDDKFAKKAKLEQLSRWKSCKSTLLVFMMYFACLTHFRQVLNLQLQDIFQNRLNDQQIIDTALLRVNGYCLL